MAAFQGLRPVGPPTVFVRPPELAGEQRRGEVERNAAMQGGMMDVTFRQELAGSGEATFPIVFPVGFVEEPIPLFGSILLPNQSLTPGDFPQITSTVRSWSDKYITDSATLYWVGANILTVGLGHDGMRFAVTGMFRGKALRNPVRQA